MGAADRGCREEGGVEEDCHQYTRQVELSLKRREGKEGWRGEGKINLVCTVWGIFGESREAGGFETSFRS